MSIQFKGTFLENRGKGVAAKIIPPNNGSTEKKRPKRAEKKNKKPTDDS